MQCDKGTGLSAPRSLPLRPVLQASRDTLRPVLVAGYGGGRIGSTTDGGRGAYAQLTESRVVVQDGVRSLIVPVDARGKAVVPGGAAPGGAAAARSAAAAPAGLAFAPEGEDAAGSHAAAGAAADASSAAADAAAARAARARAAAVSRLRAVPDYGIAGHFGEVLAVAVSPDGSTVASGGRDRVVRIWDAAGPRNLENFVGHKDAVSGGWCHYVAPAVPQLSCAPLPSLYRSRRSPSAPAARRARSTLAPRTAP